MVDLLPSALKSFFSKVFIYNLTMLTASLLFVLFVYFYGLDTILSSIFKDSLYFNPYLRSPSELSMPLSNVVHTFGFVSTLVESFDIMAVSKVRIYLFGCFWLLNGLIVSGEGQMRERLTSSFLFALEILVVTFLVLSPRNFSLSYILISLVFPVIVFIGINLLNRALRGH